MKHCPYCDCDNLLNNSSPRGVPKWKYKRYGRQTSLKGDKVEMDRRKDQARSEAVLLYLSRLSLNAIANLRSVVPSTILRWVRRFAERRAPKPQPGPGGVIVVEIDEVWHFAGNHNNELWIWLAFCRDTGQLVDWQCGDRDQGTLNTLLERLEAWTVRLYCTDSYICHDRALPVERHYQGKEETWHLEQIHSRLRHWPARFRRRTAVLSKSVEIANLTIALFSRFRINGP